MLNPTDKGILEDGIKECQKITDAYIRSPNDKTALLNLKMGVSTCIENIQFVCMQHSLTGKELNRYKLQLLVPTMVAATAAKSLPDNLFKF